jgi:hypothetical protein
MNPCHPVIARRSLLLAALALGAIGFAPSAQARVFIGVGVPFVGPYWAPPPPVYYPPPAYYPPPPVYYAPPPAYSQPAPTASQICYAPPTPNCPMERPTAPGTACYCTDSAGQRVWGRVN